MVGRLIVLVLVAFFVSFGSSGVTQAARPPAEAFGRLPLLTNVVLSPSGRFLAAGQTIDSRSVLAIYDLESRAAKPVLVPLKSVKIVNILWKSDERLIVSVRYHTKIRWIGEFEFVQLIGVDRDGGNSVRLMSGGAMIFAGGITNPLLNDPVHVLMTGVSLGGLGLFRVNILDGSAAPIEDGSEKTVEFVTDNDGEARIRRDRDNNIYHIFTRPRFGSEWREVTAFKRDHYRGYNFIGISPSNSNIAYVIAAPGDRLSLYEFDMTTAKIGKVVFGHPTVDLDDPIFDERSGALVGVRFAVDAREEQYFDPKLQALQRGLYEAVRDSPIRLIVSWSRDLTKMVVLTEGPKDPGTYYLLNRSTGEMRFFGSAYPTLQSDDLGEVRVLAYQARDGVTIPAYLTLPPNMPERGLPTVVMPHGGPTARDTLRFDWWAQFLANRGYAVLQPNFRGSGGYGFGWRRAGFGQWGKLMQNDVSDGVRYLIREGISDPSRICIVGASYGGYSALAGATLTPELYACSVSVGGISDLKMMLSNERREHGRQSDAYTYWLEQVALSNYDSRALEAVSPVDNAKAVRGPVLLIHGENDLVVDIEQSEAMDRALRRAHKPRRFVELEGEDHFLSEQATRIQMLKEIESFLAANLARPASSPASE